MSKPVIKVKELGKQYNIGALQRKQQHDTLRDRIASVFKSTKKHLVHRKSTMLGAEKFWALRDVSFEVNEGEVLGIIGKNGAGKSTLLKILCKVTSPTEGRATLNGRVGALLEVGTGFHPELTGRENIYLSGAVLGMSKAYIDLKLDDIIDFSGVETFIDTPVKRYSSGMRVRLGFAVAAHLEPEILIIDEVLAVGDAEFQRKCLGKMKDVASRGRTVLFVSHNMVAIRNLCTKVIWIEDGKLHRSGIPTEITEQYLRESYQATSLSNIQNAINNLPEDEAIRIDNVSIIQNDINTDLIANDKAVNIIIDYTVLQRTSGLRVFFDLLGDYDTRLIRSFHDENEDAKRTLTPGKYISTGVIPKNLLAPRTYEICIKATIYNVRTCMGNGIRIPITVSAMTGVNRAYPREPIRSMLQPRIKWVTKKQS